MILGPAPQHETASRPGNRSSKSGSNCDRLEEQSLAEVSDSSSSEANSRSRGKQLLVEEAVSLAGDRNVKPCPLRPHVTDKA